MFNKINFKILLGILILVTTPIFYLITNTNIDYSWYFGVFLYFAFLILLIISGLILLFTGIIELFPNTKVIMMKFIMFTPMQLFLWLSAGLIIGILNNGIMLWLIIGFLCFLFRKALYKPK